MHLTRACGSCVHILALSCVCFPAACLVLRPLCVSLLTSSGGDNRLNFASLRSPRSPSLADNLEPPGDNANDAREPLEAGLGNQYRAYQDLEAQQQQGFPTDSTFVTRGTCTLLNTLGLLGGPFRDGTTAATEPARAESPETVVKEEEDSENEFAYTPEPADASSRPLALFGARHAHLPSRPLPALPPVPILAPIPVPVAPLPIAPMAAMFNPMTVEKYGGYLYQDVNDFTDNMEEFFDCHNTTDFLLRYRCLMRYMEGLAKDYLAAHPANEQADWSALSTAFRTKFSTAQHQASSKGERSGLGGVRSHGRCLGHVRPGS
jgi:hypothetical protein